MVDFSDSWKYWPGAFYPAVKERLKAQLRSVSIGRRFHQSNFGFWYRGTYAGASGRSGEGLAIKVTYPEDAQYYGAAQRGLEQSVSREYKANVLYSKRVRELKNDDPTRFASINAISVHEMGFFTVPCNGLQIPLGFVIFEQDLSKSLDCIAQEYEVGASQFTFFFEAMADSLAAAHELAIVHRDVTPNNFLIRCSGSGSKAYFDEVILIDFGLAYVPGFQDVCLDTTTGTPGFAAPEIASGRTLTKPETYQRSDAFGLAATAYFLLYGHTPSSEEDHWAMVRNETRYPSITYGTQRRRVSLGVDIALQRGLSRNPMWRPKVSNLSSDLLRAYHQEG